MMKSNYSFRWLFELHAKKMYFVQLVSKSSTFSEFFSLVEQTYKT